MQDDSLNEKFSAGVEAQALHCYATLQPQFAVLVASAIPAILT